MKDRAVWCVGLSLHALLTLTAIVKTAASPGPTVPKTWDDEAMTSLEVPLADPVGSPKQRIGKTSRYWQFDTVREPGQRSIRSCLEQFRGHVSRYAGSIRF